MVTPGKLLASAVRNTSKSGGVLRSSSTAMRRGTGSAFRASVCPSQGSSSWAESATLSARTCAMPGWRDRKPVTSATILSRSTRSLASICTVTSLAMSRSHADADWFIM